MRREKHRKYNRLLILAIMLAAVMLMSGCRSRVTNLQDTAHVIPDEEGMIQMEYEMRRDELGLSDTRESIFSRFFTGDDTDEDDYYDDEFGDMMDEYHNTEETDDYDESNPEEADSTGTGTGRRGTAPRVPAGRGGSSVTTITVTLDANGGKVSGLKAGNIQVVEGYGYGNLPKPEYEGYLFQGWFTEKEGGDQIKSDTKVAGKKAHTLYAHWKKIPNDTYTITFDAGDGTLDESDASRKLQNGDKYGRLPDRVTREGYEFLGWYTEPDGQGDKVESGTVFNGTSNQTLYAYWKETGGSEPEPDPESEPEPEPEPDPYETWLADFTSTASSIKNKVAVYVDGNSDAEDLIKECQGKNVGEEDNPAIVFGFIDKMSDAKDKAQELKEKYGCKIVIAPKDSYKTKDKNEALMYKLRVIDALYNGLYGEDLDKAESDLGTKTEALYTD